MFLRTGIGSGGPFALAAARALIDIDGLGAEAIGEHPERDINDDMNTQILSPQKKKKISKYPNLQVS